MNMNKLFITVFCTFLIVSMPIVFAVTSDSGVVQDQSLFATPYAVPASRQTDPYLGGNFGGFVYNNPLQDAIKRSTGGFGLGPEQYLGEAIIMEVADYEPKQVRQSLLEQQDIPVFIYLRGITAGNLLSFVTGEDIATDPLSGVDNIPPIDYISVFPNATSQDSKYIRGNPLYITPRKDKYSLNNLGYLVVYLKKIENENQTPSDNSVDLDLSSKIYLRLEDSGLSGISEQDLTLKQFDNEQEFIKNKEGYSFFTGKGFIRATRITPDSVTLQVYNRNLFPLSLYTPTPSPSTTGVTPNTIIRLNKGETSGPLSFMYSGNPLTDLFQIRLNDVSVPGDKAEIEFRINGKNILRNVPVKGRLYPGSNWILTSISNTITEQIATNNLDKITFDFKLSPQQKSNIAAFINNGLNPTVFTHTMILENQLSGERKTISRKIIATSDGKALKYDYKSIGANLVEFYETNKYCGGTNPYIDPNDAACLAVKKYKELIKKYPGSKEAKDATSDLKEIYRDQLIEFKACTKELAGSATPDEIQACKEFEFEMQDLALYYADQLGERDEIIGRFGSIGGDDYLDDEGVSLKLIRTITLSEEKPSVNIRLLDDSVSGSFIEKTFRQGEVIDLGELKSVKYRDLTGANYVWRIDSVNPSVVSISLYKDLRNGKYQAIGETSRTLKLEELSSIEMDFPPLNNLNQPIRPALTKHIVVNRIESKYEAYITITPGAGKAFTTSSFRVHIPIDPRPFKWTPEQLESQIKTTKDLINDLDKIIKKLDEYISLLKKVCLGVFAFLTIKNSFTGTRNIARRSISEFFKSRCQKEMTEGSNSLHPEFNTVDSCLNHYSNEIKSSTDKVEKYMDEINNKIKGKNADDLAATTIASPSEETVCGSFKEFKEASMGENQQDIVKEYRDCLLYAKIQADTTLSSKYVEYAKDKSTQIGVLEKVDLYNKSKEYAKRTGDAYDENNSEHIKKIMLALKSVKSKDNKNLNLVQSLEITNKNPGSWAGEVLVPAPSISTSALQGIKVRGLSEYDLFVIDYVLPDAINKNICEKKIENGEWNDGLKICTVKGTTTATSNQLLTNTVQQMKQVPAYKSGLQIFIDESFYTQMNSGAGGLDTLNKDPIMCQRYDGEWSTFTFGSKCTPKEYYSTVTDISTGFLNTAYAYGDLTARYNNDGLVYCYPIGKGEYAMVLDPRYGNDLIKTIRIMNVGSNSLMECGGGDDLIAPGGDQTSLDKVNIEKKNRAIQIGENLKRCTKNLPGTARDKERVGTVDNRQVICDLSSGEKLNTLANPKCIDVMDPQDCKWLFNFCDPVMCPSSRCDLGGRVPERNVIQSGIIGSLLLCAPNIKEGIAVPICLTGVDAGLKNIKSILEGYANCLEINLKQGKNVGICDYIRSVGICEMMWKEAYNLLSISGGVIDWAAGKLTGEPQGGGEYLRFQSSLENVGSSVKVFTEEYKTTYTAQFLSQSTEEIGSQICRLSVNGKLPSIGKILDQLTEPENPPQFTAFFDETGYAAPGESSGVVGVPIGTQDLSLYNVFYHIYAGTGFYQGSYSQPQSLFAPGTQSQGPQPVSYSVYLVNREAGYPPIYVTFPGDFAQLQGRIEQGKYAQQSVQKIGKKGYNQVCVNINGIEQCGFGRVSTSFGLSELKDVINSQATKKEINSAEECVPDTPKTKGYSALKVGALGISQTASGAGGPLEILTPQAGAITSGILTSNIIESNLYSRGIIRVCSAGQPTQELGRWNNVGSCGNDEKGKSRGECWLDMSSVKIDDLKISNELKAELEDKAGTAGIISASNGQSLLRALNEERNNIINSIRSLVQKAKKVQPRLTRVVRITVPSTVPGGGATTITATTAVYTSSSPKKKEIDLSPIIYNIANKYDFGLGSGLNNYFLLKSIIKRETDWKTRDVSCAGAAGIVQLRPDTAKETGLTNIKDPVTDPTKGIAVTFCRSPNCTINSYNQEPNACKKDPSGKTIDSSYTIALKNYMNSITNDAQLANEDERFNDAKAIETLAKYLEESKKRLESDKVAVTVENLAATYQAGRGIITQIKTAGSIPVTTNAHIYSKDVRNFYDNLEKQSTATSTISAMSSRIWPLDGSIVITSCYGKRGTSDWHDGMDLRATVGTDVKVINDGVVQFLCSGCTTDPKCCGSYGNNVITKHSDGTYTRYSHLSKLNVKKGDSVTQGYIIGKSGDTGVALGQPHLDLKIYYNSNFSPDVEKPSYRRDPFNYLPSLPQYQIWTGASSSCGISPTISALKSSGVNIIPVA